jgi:hypothetical protein
MIPSKFYIGVAFHLIICIGKRGMPAPTVLPAGIQNFIDTFPPVPAGGANPSANPSGDATGSSGGVSPVSPTVVVNGANGNSSSLPVNTAPLSVVIPATISTYISNSNSPSSSMNNVSDNGSNNGSNMNGGNISDMTSSSGNTNTTTDDFSTEFVSGSVQSSQVNLGAELSRINVVPVNHSNPGSYFNI